MACVLGHVSAHHKNEGEMQQEEHSSRVSALGYLVLTHMSRFPPSPLWILA